MTNTKYTDLTQSKRLKEIGFEAEADGYWAVALKDCINDVKEKKRYFVTDEYDGDYRLHIPAYRLDTLLLALPEWCTFNYNTANELLINSGKLNAEQLKAPSLRHLPWDLHQILLDLKLSNFRGPQAIAAAVDLICLLKEIEV